MEKRPVLSLLFFPIIFLIIGLACGSGSDSGSSSSSTGKRISSIDDLAEAVVIIDKEGTYPGCNERLLRSPAFA